MRWFYGSVHGFRSSQHGDQSGPLSRLRIFRAGWAATFAVVMAITLTGCGDSEDGSATKTDGDGSVAASDPAAGDPAAGAQPAATPSDTADAPGDAPADSIPVPTADAGTDPAAIPFDPAAVPTDPAAIPFDPAAVPTDPAAVPTDPAAVPFDPAAVPTDPAAIAADPGNPIPGADPANPAAVPGGDPANSVPGANLVPADPANPNPVPVNDPANPNPGADPASIPAGTAGGLPAGDNPLPGAPGDGTAAGDGGSSKIHEFEKGTDFYAAQQVILAMQGKRELAGLDEALSRKAKPVGLIPALLAGKLSAKQLAEGKKLTTGLEFKSKRPSGAGLSMYFTNSSDQSLVLILRREGRIYRVTDMRVKKAATTDKKEGSQRRREY